jgi:hypothetical protein
MDTMGTDPTSALRNEEKLDDLHQKTNHHEEEKGQQKQTKSNRKRKGLSKKVYHKKASPNRNLQHRT